MIEVEEKKVRDKFSENSKKIIIWMTVAFILILGIVNFCTIIFSEFILIDRIYVYLLDILLAITIIGGLTLLGLKLMRIYAEADVFEKKVKAEIILEEKYLELSKRKKELNMEMENSELSKEIIKKKEELNTLKQQINLQYLQQQINEIDTKLDVFLKQEAEKTRNTELKK